MSRFPISARQAVHDGGKSAEQREGERRPRESSGPGEGGRPKTDQSLGHDHRQVSGSGVMRAPRAMMHSHPVDVARGVSAGPQRMASALKYDRAKIDEED